MSRSGSPDRVAKVTAAFGEHADGKRVHLPLITRGDALALTAQVHGQLDALAAERERLAKQDGAPVACSRGCSSCCHTAVMVYEPEAMRVAEELARPDRAEERAHFLAGYPAWHAELGKDAERIRTLHAMGRIEDAERVFFRLQSRRVMCALNRDGLCTVYESRPGICRNTHALETAERCQPGASPGPTVMGHEPMDALMAQLPRVTSSLQDARRRDEDGPPDALCAAVHRLLTQPEAAPSPAPNRNAACPCGSGAKYKHCCDFG
jgi:Fe-S-cluster containining protein